MDVDLKGAKIAIIGGNSPCEEILAVLLGPALKALSINVVMVADALQDSRGMIYARKMGVTTRPDYCDIVSIPHVDLVLKLKNDETLHPVMEKLAEKQIQILDMADHGAYHFLNFLEEEQAKIEIKQKIRDGRLDPEEMIRLFNQFSQKVQDNARHENRRLRAERESLLEMEKELSHIIQGSMIPTFIVNNEHILTHWNRACEELTGHKAYELVGTDRQWVPFRSAKRPTMADVIVGQMPEQEVTEYYGDCWRKSGLIKEAYEAEEFFPHLGEGGKWIFFTAAPIKSPDGKIIGAIETLKDITADKNAREELELQDRELSTLYDKYKRSEEKYRSLFNNNPNPIFIIDRQTLEIIDINHRVEAGYGYSKNELLGMPFLEIGDRDDETIREGLEALGKNDAILFMKKKHFRKDGRPFYVNVKVISTTYSHRDVLIASATDITQSIEKETQLMQAAKLATLGAMATGMAHEINQPLNVINICSDLILKRIQKGYQIPDEELVIMARDIADNVAQVAGIIRHVRDFARPSEGTLKKVCINDPINDVFKVLGHQLDVHAIKLDLDLDPSIPYIRAAHNRLEQVFINLVTNAMDAMDEKAQKLDRPVEKRLAIKTGIKGDRVVAEVTDTGTGMSKTAKKKIFEPFFTTKGPGKGTGLGASISFGIIKEYGGTIEIKSEAGKGTTFTLSFPTVA